LGSGIAGIRHKQTAERCFSGLWEFDVPYQLLWSSDHDTAGATSIGRHPEHTSAASWSWASIAGPVNYIERAGNQFVRRSGQAEVEPLLRVTKAMALPAIENTFGAVKTGIITATSQVLPVKYDTVRAVWRPDMESDPTKTPASNRTSSLAMGRYCWCISNSTQLPKRAWCYIGPENHCQIIFRNSEVRYEDKSSRFNPLL
jgi:hypothetical protein